MHIGTLRTALFDYFLSKQTGGQFVLRIEDTDRERFVEGAMENLIEVFNELGIFFDEGPMFENEKIVQRGDHGPYIQSERLELYRPYVDKLIEQGDAYPCFCSKERLDEMRAEQRETKQTPKYDRACLALDAGEVKKRMKTEPYVVRMKIPEGETVVDDVVRGKVKFNHADVDDQVILKSDGFPTYHLAVVVDDELMKITHVIRGEEWLSSTPKHIILQKMLGFDVPTYAHVPLLLNADKTKLSKRQGDVAVEDYLQKGYLKEALLNFIGTLGYNPTGDREVYSLEELTDLFDLKKVKKSGAVMNIEKLDWMNNQYIQKLGLTELAEAAKPFLKADVDDVVVQRALFVERERVNRLDELQDRIKPYLKAPKVDAEMLIWKKADAADAKNQLEGIRAEIEAMPEDIFEDVSYIEDRLMGYIKKNDLKNGNVLWPLRVALSRQERSAGPFDYLWALGGKESLKRIDASLKVL